MSTLPEPFKRAHNAAWKLEQSIDTLLNLYDLGAADRGTRKVLRYKMRGCMELMVQLRAAILQLPVTDPSLGDLIAHMDEAELMLDSLRLQILIGHCIVGEA
jgi:hypothetical protein